MAIYYVRKDGNDANTGLTDDAAGALLTITHANAHATTAGDTVVVHAGTYNEKVWLTHSGSAGSYITYQAYTGETVIIDGTGINLNPFSQEVVDHTYANLWSQGLVKIKDINYVIVDGFEIYNADLIGSDGVAIVAFAGVTVDHVTIKNCKVHTSGRAGIGSYYATTGAFTNITVDNCEVYDTNYIYNSGEMITFSKVTTGEIKNCLVHDAYWNGTRYQQMIDAKDGSTGILIHDNEIYGTGDVAIYIDGASADAYNNYIHGADIDVGIQLDNEIEPLTHMDSNLYNNIIAGVGTGFKVQIPNLHNDGTADYTFEFINNTIYDSYGSDAAPVCMYGASANYTSCIIRNNIIMSIEAGSINLLYCQNTPSGITIDHNLFYNTGGSTVATNKGTNYLETNPLMTDPTGSNFTLSSSSPARDTGSSTDAPTTDYAGYARPSGSGYDIGAYEYVVVISSPVTVVVSTTNPISTTADSLCAQLSQDIGDYIVFDTTTTIAASKLIVSTTLNEYDNASDDYFIGWYVYIIEGNNTGSERRVSDYATSTGTLTVYGANFTADSGAITCELRRYSRASVLRAINNASKEVYPDLGEYYEDTSIVTGNWLPNGNFGKFTNSVLPNFYNLVSATASSSAFGMSSQSVLLTATADGGYMSTDSSQYPRLLQLMNTTVDFKVWAYPNKANDTTINIVTFQADGTTQTLSSTTTTYANKWNLIELKEQKLNDNLTYVFISFRLGTASQNCYLDNAQLFGKPIEKYLLPTSVHNGKIVALYIQNWSHSNEYLDPCDVPNPESWKRIFNWQYEFDGTNDWLDIPNQTERLKIKALTLNPLDQLTLGTDTVNINGRRVNLLLAYAKYKLYQQQRSVPSSQDVTRFDKFMAESLAEYNRLLPSCRIPQVLETVRVRY
jgi:hypothetical protein